MRRVRSVSTFLQKLLAKSANVSVSLVLVATTAGVAPLLSTQKVFAASCTAASSSIKINEIYSNPSAGNSEWVELYNSDGSDCADISGWKIKSGTSTFATISNNVTIAAHGYFVTAATTGTNLSDSGTTLHLLPKVGSTDVDTVVFPALTSGESYGRSPDGSSNLVTFPPAEVTKDTQNYFATPGVPTPTAPANNALLSTNLVTLTWTASTAGANPVANYTVQLSQDATFTSNVGGTTTTGLSYAPSGALSDGSWYWRVKATDSAANDSSWSSTQTFTIDTTAPDTPTLTGPTNGGYYNINTNDFTFSWDSVSDPSTPVTYNWESSATNATNPDGSFVSQLAHHEDLTDTSLPEGNLPDGTYYWHVRACDAAGNCGAWAAPWSVTVDTTNPVVNITSPADNSSVSGLVTLDGTATDSNPNYYYWTATYSDGTSSSTDNIFQTTVSPLPVDTMPADDGAYTLTLTAVDQAGNTASDAILVTVDNTPPTVLFVTPSTSGEWSRGKLDVKISGMDFNALSTLSVNLYQNNTLLSSGCGSANVSGTSATYSCTINTKDYGAGAYELVATAKDITGNVSTTTTDVQFDNIKPSVSIDSPANHSSVSNLSDFSVTGTASDHDSGLKHHKVRVKFINTTTGTVVYKQKVDVDAANDWVLNVPASTLPDGSYKVVATAHDWAGNKSHATIDITVDSTAPQLAIVNKTQNSNGTYIIQGTTDDPDSPVLVGLDGTILLVVVQDAHGNWTAKTGVLTAGSSHIVTATSTDDAGNTGTQTASFTVPTPTPQNNGGGNTGSQGGIQTTVITAATNPQSGGTNNSSTNSSTGSDSKVLSDSSSSNTHHATGNTGHVKGDQTNTDKHTAKFLGLAWNWWLPIALIAIFLLFALYRRIHEDDEAA